MPLPNWEDLLKGKSMGFDRPSDDELYRKQLIEALEKEEQDRYHGYVQGYKNQATDVNSPYSIGINDFLVREPLWNELRRISMERPKEQEEKTIEPPTPTLDNKYNQYIKSWTTSKGGRKTTQYYGMPATLPKKVYTKNQLQHYADYLGKMPKTTHGYGSSYVPYDTPYPYTKPQLTEEQATWARQFESKYNTKLPYNYQRDGHLPLLPGEALPTSLSDLQRQRGLQKDVVRTLQADDLQNYTDYLSKPQFQQSETNYEYEGNPVSSYTYTGSKEPGVYQAGDKYYRPVKGKGYTEITMSDPKDSYKNYLDMRFPHIRAETPPKPIDWGNSPDSKSFDPTGKINYEPFHFDRTSGEPYKGEPNKLVQFREKAPK